MSIKHEMTARCKNCSNWIKTTHEIATKQHGVEIRKCSAAHDLSDDEGI